MPVSLEEVKRSPRVEVYLARGDAVLEAMGFTEHSYRHANLVAKIARNVLHHLAFPEAEAELAAIAGYLHDMGNVAGRFAHAQTGAVLADGILRDLGMPPTDVATVIGAIGNHEEADGHVVHHVGAALVLADKSDVHRSRVRNPEPAAFDIHDRVNYAAEHSFLRVEPRRRAITLELRIDTEISPVMDYFEIFLSRMVMCRRAAEFLKCNFELSINQVRLL